MMRNLSDMGGFQLFRWLECLLPVPLLWGLLYPFAWIRALRFRKVATLPRCFGSGARTPFAKRRVYLNRALEFIPDRLVRAKWRERYRIEGLEHLTGALNAGRPVVFACCHFGPYPLLRFLLRAAGFPVTVVIRGTVAERDFIRWKTDPLSPFPEKPVAYCQDQLREMIHALRSGCPVIVAVDTNIGRTLPVALDDATQFTLATGAMRLALRSGADLLPLTIIDEGVWRFRIVVDAPVPLIDEDGFAAAGSQLMRTLIAHMREHPEQVPPALPGFFTAKAPGV